MSTFRKLVIALASIWVLLGLAALAVGIFPAAFHRWPLWLVLALTLCGSFVCAGAMIEMLRNLVPCWAVWNDVTHMLAVLLTFVLLGTIQCAGVILVLNSFPSPDLFEQSQLKHPASERGSK